jgi:hypothetical protein
VDCVGDGRCGGGGEFGPTGRRLVFLAGLYLCSFLFSFLFIVRGFSGPRGLAHSAPAEGGGDRHDEFPLYALL